MAWVTSPYVSTMPAAAAAAPAGARADSHAAHRPGQQRAPGALGGSEQEGQAVPAGDPRGKERQAERSPRLQVTTVLLRLNAVSKGGAQADSPQAPAEADRDS